MGHCIYCNSTTYGRPCLFSPSNTHVHFDDPNKCIYCGSRSVGSGCIYNPHGKIHVRGPEFLTSSKDYSKKSVILKYLFENVNAFDNEPYTSPLNRFYKRLCHIIATASQPLLEALSIQIRPSYAKLDKHQTLKANEIKNRLKEQYGEIYETIKYANLSLPQEIVEEIIIDVIMADSEKK
jgi:hypothetical protein